MRAAVLREGELTVRETADPEPGSGHLLLRTLVCAVCASDVHFMDHGADESGGGLFGGYDARADVVMGHEFVGEVVGHGADVDDGLDGVAEALDAVRNAQGPPRIVVKPNGTGAR